MAGGETERPGAREGEASGRVRAPRLAGDEYLELLWYARERGEDLAEADIDAEPGLPMSSDELAGLVREGFAERVSPGSLRLTGRGEVRAALLVRSHRLAERLVHDVLGESYEQGACEFEHILNPALVDSICTLLGHPRECPHGMPIPAGECCRTRLDTVSSTVMALTDLGIGETARIAYVYGDTDRQLHKLENLQIRPGVEIRLHQRSPSIVVECEGSTIAMDERVAANLHVWVPPGVPTTAPESLHGNLRERRRHRYRHG